MPRQLFARGVRRYRGVHKVRHCSCHGQFLCLAFAQLTGRESLRAIEVCLHARPARRYRLGLGRPIARRTLAEAKGSRAWRIYGDRAQALIGRARELYAAEALGLALAATVHALASTTIELCLSLCPWARYQRTCGAIKLYTLLDRRGPLPSFLQFSDGQQAGVTVRDALVPEPGSFSVLARGHLDFWRRHRFHQAGTFFVTRAQRGLRLLRSASRPVGFASGRRCD